MKSWQVRDWLDTECCGRDGAVEIETGEDDGMVCDGDRARCIVHDRSGTVAEYCGIATIVWDDEGEI